MFGRRFDIFSVGGIKIGIDISWFYIAFILSWTLTAAYFPFYYPRLSTATYWVMGVLGMLGLFVCVILHELSHAMVAKAYGLPIARITLFIFGGVAEIKKEPHLPKVEFLMAIAGPIMSLVLALIAFLLSYWGAHSNWSIIATGVLSYLAVINFVLALFNLLPAFPLDGGRVLRAIIWGWKGDLTWATQFCTALGAGIGMGMIFFGIFVFVFISLVSGLWLVLIGWFLHRAAQVTLSQFFMEKELKGEKVENFMKRDPISVPPDISIQEFIDHYLLQTYHHLYPVTKNGSLVGLIRLQDIKGIDKQQWSSTRVETLMLPRERFLTATPDTNALDILKRFQEGDSSTIVIVKDDQLVGILTAEDLFKIISLKLELEGKKLI